MKGSVVRGPVMVRQGGAAALAPPCGLKTSVAWEPALSFEAEKDPAQCFSVDILCDI